MIASPTSRTCATNSSMRQLGAVAGDRLELVERAAGVAEPAAAHLPERHAAGRDDRRDRERRLVADAARRVLVDDLAAERGAEVDRLAAADHRVGQRERLAPTTGRGSRRPCRTPPSGSRAPRRARSRGSARRARRPASSSPVALALDELGRPDRHDARNDVPGTPAGGLAAEPRVDRGADVGELAVLQDPPAGVSPLDIRQQQRVLAGVVGGRRRRVAAVVGRQDQQIAGPERVEQVGQAPVAASPAKSVNA